jgi:hypothetical protein
MSKKTPGHLAPVPEDFDATDARDVEAQALRDRAVLDVAWSTIRESSGGRPILRMVDDATVHWSAPGRDVAFGVDDLPSLRAVVAMLGELSERRGLRLALSALAGLRFSAKGGK